MMSKSKNPLAAAAAAWQAEDEKRKVELHALGKEPFDPEQLVKLWFPPELGVEEHERRLEWAREMESSYYCTGPGVSLVEFAKELDANWGWAT